MLMRWMVRRDGGDLGLWTHLSAADPVLGTIIAAGRDIHPRPHEDLYLALLRAIVSQQISTKAAESIRNKVIQALGGRLLPKRFDRAWTSR